MAYLPGGKPPRANYTPQGPATRRVSRGSVSKPTALPKWSLSASTPSTLTRRTL